MLVLIKANILAVGLKNRSGIEDVMPARFISVAGAVEAGRSLKNENVRGIISSWDLPDAPNGRFIKAVRSAKPYLPVIAVVEAGKISDEIAARSAGVAAVVCSEQSDEIFRWAIAEVFGLYDAERSVQNCVITNEVKH